MNFLLPPLPARSTEGEHTLKRTRSRCPVCLTSVPAEVIRSGPGHGRVDLRRTCPTHGTFSACLASDARFYWLSHGHPDNASEALPSASPAPGDSCGCRNGACRASDGAVAGTLGRNATRSLMPTDSCETLSTCLALIEIVDSCNLACPTCFADSPIGVGSKVKAPPLSEVQTRIQNVIDRKGPIEILQLSGGEPTLHPQFFELLAWTMENDRIGHVLLNTNGVRIAREEAFAQRLGQIARKGRFQLYLQFDGPQAAGQTELRGADLRSTRNACLARCSQLDIAVTLAMTVNTSNLPHLWESIRFGLSHSHVRGISFQPEFRSGRTPHASSESSKSPPPVTVADIILHATAQSDGVLSPDAFTPLPCGDPNCATIGYLLRMGDEVVSISDFVDFRDVQGFLHNRVRYSLEDLARCGCESEPLGALLKQFELDASHTFRIFIKPFMDAWTWDQDRIDRCCTHVIRPDGQLDSFCRYYSRFP